MSGGGSRHMSGGGIRQVSCLLLCPVSESDRSIEFIMCPVAESDRRIDFFVFVLFFVYVCGGKTNRRLS